jgi:type II secretory pathway component GspD/PulD (secretin)
MSPNMKAKIFILPLFIGCTATLLAAPQSGSPKRDAPAKPDRQVLLAQEKGAFRLMTFETPKSEARELRTYSSLDRPEARSHQEVLAKGSLRFEEADVLQVLKLYQELSGRTVIRAGALPVAKISLQNETPFTRLEVLQALDTVLAENGITMILLGSKFVKAVPSAQAPSEAAPEIDFPADQLPESSSYMVYVVQLKHRRPSEVAMALQPFARMPNSIVALKDADLLILRDYSSNIRRMLQVLERIDREPAE